jgi:hypothetical protein
MKKLLLLIPAFLFTLSFNAQTSIAINDMDGFPVANAALVEVVTTVGGLPDEYDFTIRNTSASSKDYHVIRIDNMLNKTATDTASAYFCFGTACFPASTTITPTPYTLAPNGTQALKMYLQEGSVQGYSSVTYKVVNAANGNDMMYFTLSYNSALSIHENSDLFTAVSNIYPNPAFNSAHIKLKSSVNVKSAEVKIINTLGTIVSSCNTELNIGENTVNMNTENLSAGIYFGTISYGKNKVVKKFTVNK